MDLENDISQLTKIRITKERTTEDISGITPLVRSFYGDISKSDNDTKKKYFITRK